MPQPVPAHSMSTRGNAATASRIGERLGAHVAPDEQGAAGCGRRCRSCRGADGSNGLYPHLVLDRAKPGLIAVNAAGRRFVNEAASYHDFVLAMFESHKTRADDAGLADLRRALSSATTVSATCIPGTRDLRGFESSGYLVAAQTLDELAGKIAVDAAGLRATVARHNRFAETGVDVDFGKGETELNRFNGDPGAQAQSLHRPDRAPPFYALAVWPADIAVSTGLATDADARVLDADGRPIPGLYACGNDMASIMAGTYPGPGTTLGPAIVFAYRAVMHACGRASA